MKSRLYKVSNLEGRNFPFLDLVKAFNRNYGETNKDIKVNHPKYDFGKESVVLSHNNGTSFMEVSTKNKRVYTPSKLKKVLGLKLKKI